MSLPALNAKSLYTPLPKDMIRCIRLTGTSLVEEHARHRDLAIECSLETVQLSDVRQKKISYHALSYVWGSPKFCRWVICNGVLSVVTSNLYEALWHFIFGIDTPPLLWIDALCINQKDDADKAQQVAMMADIYREAEQVMIWLGTDPAANPALERFWINLSTVGAREAVKDREAFDRGAAFINRADWFTRTWTMQEIILAREARVYYSFFSVDWAEFVKLSAIADDNYFTKTIDQTDEASSSRPGTISSGNSFRNTEASTTSSLFPAIEIISRLQQPGQTQSPTLYQLIRATWDRDATNPRDNFYGLLGLWDGGASIIPDYSQTVLHVFADAVFTILKEDKWLWLNMKNIRPLTVTRAKCFKSRQSILSVDTHASSVSWIPDLRDRNEEDIDKLANFVDDWRFQGPKWPEPVFTSLHPSFVPDFGRSGTNLLARGVILGAWRQVEAFKKAGWQYMGEGVFDGFPPCVAKFSMEDFHHEPEITFPSASAVYETMLKHIKTNCACDKSTNAADRSHDSSLGAGDTSTVTWLCFIFGRAEPLILKPQYCTERPGLVFLIVNRLPYQHPWAAQILRAGRFEDSKHDDDPWHNANRWRMSDRISDNTMGWHDWLVGFSRIKGRLECRGEISPSSFEDYQPLSLAFREGVDEEKRALKRLENTSNGMPDLNECHLNWIPTTLEIVGCPESY